MQFLIPLCLYTSYKMSFEVAGKVFLIGLHCASYFMKYIMDDERKLLY